MIFLFHNDTEESKIARSSFEATA